MSRDASSQRNPETTPPDGPPRDPVDPIPREDPTSVPDPKPIDDPRPGNPGKTYLGSLDLEVARLMRMVDRRLN